MTEKSLAESSALEVADVVLKLADLRAGYGSVPVLNGVNLEVHEGEAVGVCVSGRISSWRPIFCNLLPYGARNSAS